MLEFRVVISICTIFQRNNLPSKNLQTWKFQKIDILYILKYKFKEFCMNGGLYLPRKKIIYKNYLKVSGAYFWKVENYLRGQLKKNKKDEKFG